VHKRCRYGNLSVQLCLKIPNTHFPNSKTPKPPPGPPWPQGPINKAGGREKEVFVLSSSGISRLLDRITEE